VAMVPTACALCGTCGNARELYPANFTPEALNPTVFSARRLPDRLHLRVVRCRGCGLVRSDPLPPAELLARLYAASSLDYHDEVGSLRATYGRCLRRLRPAGAGGSLLEIGCGSGFMLDEALDQGFAQVAGVEPSGAAVVAASERVRARIVVDVMRPGLFAPDSFDVVCMFQVLDHLPDPGAVIAECVRVLRPGGRMLCLNHNVDAVSARLLGEASPIVDIEHTYLYNPRTMAALLARHGLRVAWVRPVWNLYSLHYLVRLLPLPAALKRPLLKTLAASAAGRLRLCVPLGNLVALGVKPDGPSPSAELRHA